MPNHGKKRTTYAFLDIMFSRFGVSKELFIDKSKELCGDFQELCEKALIDHSITSQGHPEADGLIK